MAYTPPVPTLLNALSSSTLSPLNGDTQTIRADASGGALTLTLYTPTAAMAGNTVTVHKTTAAYTVTLDGNGTLIDGDATVVLTGEGEAVTLATDGTLWTVTSATNRTSQTDQTMRVGALIAAGASTFTTPLADSNLATISTPGKIANAATTATDANTPSTLVARDGSGNFSAGAITATTFTGALSGNASTATKLAASQTFALTGDVTGSVSSDLTSGVSIATTLDASVTAGKATNLAGGAQYSVPYQSAANTTAFVAIGSPGAVLTSNGTGSAPSWQTPSTVSASADNLTGGAAGDLLYQSAGGTTAKLSIGSTGQVLTVSGGVPAWGSTVANLAGGAANRLPYQTGVGATGFLAAPTVANSYLRWSGSALEWGTVSATADSTKNVIGNDSSGGSAGQVIYQSGASTTAFTATGTAGHLLQSNGTSAPSWKEATASATANAVAVRNGSGQLAGDITGNAATVTNGVVTTGSYSNPAWITALAGSKITGNISGNAANVTGTVAVANGGTGAGTLTGYVYGNGTGAMTASTTIPGSAISGNISGSAANITTYTINQSLATSSSPTFAGLTVSGTIAGNITGNAGTVTNGVVSTGSYANPAWITSLAGSKISGDISGNASNITAYTINQSVGTGNTPTFASATLSGSGAVLTTSTAGGTLRPHRIAYQGVFGGLINFGVPATLGPLDSTLLCTGTTGTIDIAGVVASFIGQELVIANVTGGTINLLHDSGSALNVTNRILTPSGSTVAIALGQAIRLIHVAQDAGGTNARWIVLAN